MDFLAAVFDLDGTLIDSNPVWEKLDRIILNRRGIYKEDSFFHTLAAMTYEEVAEVLKSLGADISFDEFVGELNELAVYEYAHNIKLKDGAYDYLHFLKEKNVKITLATASPEKLYKPVLENNGVYDLFDAFTTTDEVRLSKDYPDVYIKSARKVCVPTEHCAAFEDVLKGVKSAKAAGMFSVGVFDESSSADWDKIKNISDKFILSFNEML